jgi:hypothetical protein
MGFCSQRDPVLNLDTPTSEHIKKTFRETTYPYQKTPLTLTFDPPDTKNI